MKIWDSATGKELFALKGHAGWVTSVAFSPDGQRLASANQDGSDPSMGDNERLSAKYSTVGQPIKWWPISSERCTCVPTSSNGCELCPA